MQRWIELDGVVNMRDVGGLPTRDGGRVASRRLIRSDNLQDLSPADVRHLVHDIGVSDVVDLRTLKELRLAGDGPLRATPLHHHHHSFYPDPRSRDDEPDFTGDQPVREAPRADPDYWSQHYQGYLAQRPDSVTAALSVIATASGATIVHCAAGKDRTGTVVGLALSIAGVPREAIVEDYVLTSERLDKIMARLLNVPPYNRSLAGQTAADQRPMATSMERLLDVVDQEYGGAERWLRLQGWTDGEVTRLRSKLRDP